jgi:sugar/nucleoside kinase (ribokinase family)
LLLDAGDPDAAAWAAGVARTAGVPVVLDADRFEAALEPLLARVDFPIVSRQFAETFSSNGCVRETLRALQRFGARLAAVTLGDRGVMAACEEEVIEIAAVPVKARDTIGAGDVFHGAFAWGLLAGFLARQTLRAAAAAAAMNCRAPGAQGGIPERAALERFLHAQPTDFGEN